MADSLFEQIGEEMAAMERKVSEMEQLVQNLQDANYELIRDADLQIKDLVAQAFDARARSARWKRCAKRLRKRNRTQYNRTGFVVLIAMLGWASIFGLWLVMRFFMDWRAGQ